MTINVKCCVTITCALAVAVLNAGCHHQTVVSQTPQQRQTNIAANSHIPPAQKAAIESQIGQQSQKAQQ